MANPISVTSKANERSGFQVDHIESTTLPGPWKGYEKILFRIAFLFFVSMSIPSSRWYENFFAIDWTSPHYRDLYLIGRYIPKFIDTDVLPWLRGYQTFLFLLLLSIVGGVIWTLLDSRRRSYNQLYYWLRTLVRYRAAIYMIVWGLVKIFPVQCPYPSEGILNTSIGDLPIQKIYWWSVGAMPYYEVFGGAVEFSAGFLLFFRKTEALGAALMAGTLAVLTSANMNYGGGVHTESTYFAISGLFLLVYYARGVYKLLVLQQDTLPFNYVLKLHSAIKIFRWFVRSTLVLVFLIVMPYLSYLNFRYDPYNQAVTASPVELRGVYAVDKFILNGKEIPYNAYDPLRWEDVTFEKWTTLTYKVFQPIDFDKPFIPDRIGFNFNSGAPMRDIDRNLESFTGDSRRAFHYYVDPIKKMLYLEDKSVEVNRKNYPATDSVRNNSLLYSSDWISKKDWQNINDEYTKVIPKARFARRYKGYQKEYPVDRKRNRMILHYEIPDKNTVLLTGTTESNDSLQVLLKRITKKYTLPDDTLKSGNYD